MKRVMIMAVLASIAAAPVAAQEGTSTDPQREVIVRKLGSVKVSVDFQDVAITEAIDFIREFSGLNIVIDPSVGMNGSEDLRVTIKVKNLLLKSVLKLMLHPHNLGATYREGAIVIMDNDMIRARSVKMRMYDVRDILLKIQDFPGPQVELKPQGEGPGLDLGGFDPPKEPITAEFLVEIIRDSTGGDTWDEDPNTAIELVNGVLIVKQSAKVHKEIWQLLGKLRQFK